MNWYLFTMGCILSGFAGAFVVIAVSRSIEKSYREYIDVLEEKVASNINAERSAKFRQRTAESNPNRQAKVSKVRLRAYRYKLPIPRKRT